MADSRTGAGVELTVNPAWEVHPAEVKRWLKNKEEVVLLDVRNLPEWNFCRIEGAVAAPLPELEGKAAGELQGIRSKRVVVYCHHGVRSLRATAMLRHFGFENVHSMAGGIEAWSVIVDPGVPRY